MEEGRAQVERAQERRRNVEPEGRAEDEEPARAGAPVLRQGGDHDEREAELGAGAVLPEADFPSGEGDKAESGEDDEGEHEAVAGAAGDEPGEGGQGGQEALVDVEEKDVPAGGADEGGQGQALEDVIREAADEGVAHDEHGGAAEKKRERRGGEREGGPEPAARGRGGGEARFREEGDEFGATPPREGVERMVDLEAQPEVGGGILDEVEERRGQGADAAPEPPDVGRKFRAAGPCVAAPPPDGAEGCGGGEGEGGNSRGGAEPEADGAAECGDHGGAPGVRA